MLSMFGPKPYTSAHGEESKKLVDEMDGDEAKDMQAAKMESESGDWAEVQI
jgi:hypothetical protein